MGLAASSFPLLASRPSTSSSRPCTSLEENNNAATNPPGDRVDHRPYPDHRLALSVGDYGPGSGLVPFPSKRQLDRKGWQCRWIGIDRSAFQRREILSRSTFGDQQARPQ